MPRTLTNALGDVVEEELPDGVIRRAQLGLRGELRGLTIETTDGVITERPIVDAITYSARGQRIGLMLGNGVARTSTWDVRTGRLMRNQAARPAGSAVSGDLMDVHYRYDPAGNITAMHDVAQDPNATAGPFAGGTGPSVTAERDYAYDSHFRLRRATGRMHQALVTTGGAPQEGIFAPVSLNDSAGLARYTRRYNYDDGGNLVQIAQSAPGVTGGSWTFDKWVSATSNRQTELLDSDGIAHSDPEAFFDQAGNRTEFAHLTRLDWTDAGRLRVATKIERSGMADDAEYYVYGGATALRQRKITQVITNATTGATQEVETRTFHGVLGSCELRTATKLGSQKLERHTSHLNAPGEDGTAERFATLHRWLASS